MKAQDNSTTSNAADMQTLRFEQAPPLDIPAAFFLTAPLAVVAAGMLLLATGTSALQSHWLPVTLGLTHLASLGFLAMVMLGALYQMAPVVASAPVPRVRIAHLVHGLLSLAVLRLVLGLTGLWPGMVYPSFSLAGVALGIFVLTVGFAMLNSPTRNMTVASMRLALLSLLFAVVLGILMARGFAGGVIAPARGLWIQVHLTLAMLGWVGGMISGVSWRVVPMFYLAPPVPLIWQRIVWTVIAFAVTGSLLVLWLAQIGIDTRPWALREVASITALPAVAGLCLLHPYLILRSLKHRRRRRLDGSALFWFAGLGMAPLAALTALGAIGLRDPHWVILSGWLAIWGWAGLVIHGMLSRIVPFLVWFHRYAPLAGTRPIASMRTLLPGRVVKIGLVLHMGSLLAGTLAIATQYHWLASLTGIALLATGLHMLGWMGYVFSRHPDGTRRRLPQSPFHA